MQLKQHIIEKYSQTADFIKKNFEKKIKVSIVAGSGFAVFFDVAKLICEYDYNDIPNLPRPNVEGHFGKLKLVRFANHNCLLFLGRTHFYEGAAVEEVSSFSIISSMLGIDNIILTNAAGGLNRDFRIGDAMIANDFINFLYRSSSELFQIDAIYQKNSILSKKWIDCVRKELIQAGLRFSEGVYLSTLGPSYETSAEIRFFKKLGADAAGMSTIIEAEVAAKLGLNVLAVSLITNLLNEYHTTQISHD